MKDFTAFDVSVIRDTKEMLLVPGDHPEFIRPHILQWGKNLESIAAKIEARLPPEGT